MAYELTHRTEYRYPAPVSASYGEVIMMPRDLPGQRCLRRELVIEPEPHDLRERQDFFGNRATYFAVLAEHTRLAVTANSVVEVAGRGLSPDQLHSEHSWEADRERLRTGTDQLSLDARQFVLDSPRITSSSRLVAYASASFRPGRGLLEATVDLCSRVHRDFTFQPGATHVTSTIDEVFDSRAGVCQDFAHLAIGCLRSLGLPARYVSGYLETIPPPGEDRLAGADVSHAWLSVFTPDLGWVDVDPTNDQLLDDRYVTTAWGRDYADVTPLKGVIFTDGEGHTMSVSVDMVAVPDPA
jgi:transglutaminase-like putative cysteine protease